METTRTQKVFFNITSNILILMIKTILTFATRTVFIKILGQEALGVNGLLTNILSMLSLAELGISTAINFSLYKPLANKDEKSISAIMSLYRKVYIIIGIIIFIIGTVLIPFLSFFVNDINQITNFYYIYLLYLINTCFTYFLAYKEVLINADQKNYKLSKIRLIFLILLNSLLIVTLYITKDFISYLIMQFIITLIERIVVNIFITKQYKNIKFNSKDKISVETKKEIKKNIKAMFFHKIGDYCINGTDNIIISKFINIAVVGCYSNYLMIISLINSFITTTYNAMISTFGNLIVLEQDGDKRKEKFEIINFFAFVLYGISSVCLINCLNPFIILWIGEDYIFDFSIIIVIIVNFYLTGMRVPVATVKSASGLYDVDKYTPLIQAAINLVVSIILVQYIGLLGVILGTLASSICIPCWQRPYLVYKYVFKKSSKSYFYNYIKYIIVIFIAILISLLINAHINILNNFIELFVKFFISVIIFGILVLLFFKNTKEYKYIKELIQKMIKRIVKKND